MLSSPLRCTRYPPSPHSKCLVVVSRSPALARQGLKHSNYGRRKVTVAEQVVPSRKYSSSAKTTVGSQIGLNNYESYRWMPHCRKKTISYVSDFFGQYDSNIWQYDWHPSRRGRCLKYCQCSKNMFPWHYFKNTVKIHTKITDTLNSLSKNSQNHK